MKVTASAGRGYRFSVATRFGASAAYLLNEAASLGASAVLRPLISGDRQSPCLKSPGSLSRAPLATSNTIGNAKPSSHDNGIGSDRLSAR